MGIVIHSWDRDLIEQQNMRSHSPYIICGNEMTIVVYEFCVNEVDYDGTFAYKKIQNHYQTKVYHFLGGCFEFIDKREDEHLIDPDLMSFHFEASDKLPEKDFFTDCKEVLDTPDMKFFSIKFNHTEFCIASEGIFEEDYNLSLEETLEVISENELFFDLIDSHMKYLKSA